MSRFRRSHPRMQTPKHPHPIRSFLELLLLICVCEAVVMAILMLLGTEGYLGIVLDSTLLACFVAPLLYRLSVRPLREKGEWMETVLDNVQAGILVIDPETTQIMDVNSEALHVMKRPKEEILGSPCRAHFLHCEEVPCPAKTQQVSNTQTETTLLTGQGDLLPVLQTVAEIKLNGHRFYLKSFVDISERKRAEEILNKSKSKLQAVFEGISDPLVMLGHDLKVQMLNSAAREYYGLTDMEDVTDKSCYEGLRGNSRPCEGCTILPSLIDGRAGAFERRGLMDPSRVEKVVVYPLHGTEEDDSGMLLRINDISDAKLVERQMVQNEKLTALGLLVSGIAHDINNPNNFISFNIPILRDYLQGLLPILDDYAGNHPDYELFGMPYTEFRKDLLRLVENLEHGSDRIKGIVSNLREFVMKREKGEEQWIELEELFQKSLSICRGEIEGKVRSLETILPEDLPPVFACPESLELILVNFLVNAAQAADKHDSWIRLSAARGQAELQDQILIQVSDNGCGMDPETREKIFDAFFSTKSSGTGTGLGLYVSHSLIEGMGGNIEVESAIGKGSTFRVILPIQKQEAVVSHVSSIEK